MGCSGEMGLGGKGGVGVWEGSRSVMGIRGRNGSIVNLRQFLYKLTILRKKLRKIKIKTKNL